MFVELKKLNQVKTDTFALSPAARDFLPLPEGGEESPFWVWQGEVVWGRLSAKSKPPWSALLIDPQITSAVEVWSKAIAQIGQRVLAHPLIKASVIQVAQRLMIPPLFPLSLLKHINEPATRQRWEQLMRVSNLIPALQDVLILKDIPLKIFLFLIGWSNDDQQILAEFLRKSTWFNKTSVSRCREFLELLHETLNSEKRPLPFIIEKLESEVKQNDDFNQFYQNQKSWLWQRRYPNLAKRQSEIERLFQSLKVPSGMQIIPPENMEGAQLRVSLHFKTKEQCRQAGQTLIRIAEENSLSQILKLL